MPELADILIRLGIIGAIISIIWQYFLSRKQNRTPPECLLAGFLALPITGDHWIAVLSNSNCHAKIDQGICAKDQNKKAGIVTIACFDYRRHSLISGKKTPAGQPSRGK